MGTTDYQDAILTNTSADCADYAGDYSADVLDINQNKSFTSTVSIVAGGDSCTLTSNGIPNTDFDDSSARSATQTAEVPEEFTIPPSPTAAAQITQLSQSFYNGVILNGVPLDVLSAGCYKPTDPRANDAGIVPIGCNVDSAWLADPLGLGSNFGADGQYGYYITDEFPYSVYCLTGTPDPSFKKGQG